MNLDFTVTDINRIIFVDDLEYPNQKIDFNRPLNYHELIFTFSGHKIARFNGTELHDRTNSIRYLPQGPVSGYSVERLEPGPCIDIFFSTDRPISDGPFVLQFGQNSRFATLFQTSSTVLDPNGLPEADARVLQDIADRVALEGQSPFLP